MTWTDAALTAAGWLTAGWAAGVWIGRGIRIADRRSGTATLTSPTPTPRAPAAR